MTKETQPAKLSKHEAATQVQELIKTHFAEVSRAGGVSLHQTAVIDDNGTPAELAEALKQDTDTHWTEVQDEWLEGIDYSGGLSFLDDIGFKYYAPAYMDWFIRVGEEAGDDVADMLLYRLQRGTVDKHFETVFDPEQLKTILAFLDYTANYSEAYTEDATFIAKDYRRSFDFKA